MQSIDNFIDDVIIYTESFRNICDYESVLERLCREPDSKAKYVLYWIQKFTMFLFFGVFFLGGGVV